MEKNIENNTENKFGNFLNFMKKFLAMSFFCAMAAFGFGALSAKATQLDTTTKGYYSNVADINTSSQKISEVAQTDYEKYKEENDGVLYYDNSSDVTAYALKRDSGGNVEEKTDLEISASEKAGYDLSKPVTKIHTQLIDDGVTDLTIKGYDSGNVTPSGTVDGTKTFNSLTVTNGEGKAVTRTALAQARSDFANLVNTASTDIKTPSALKLSTTNLVVDNSRDWDKSAIKTEIEDKIKVTTLDGTPVTGTWGTTLNDVSIGKYKIDYTPTSDALPIETFEITITTATKANAETGKTESDKIEYTAGQTTWGKILEKAQVNTSAEKGAKGFWKVATDRVEGTIIDYRSGLEYLGKMEPGLTQATLTYISGEGDSFADSDSITIFLKDRTEDLKEFGNYEFKTFGDYTFFVNKDTGSTCTMLSSEKGQISWLREESYGTAAWYGFDNSEGALPEGSVVSVKWYGKDDEGYSEKLEKAAKGIQSLGIVAEKDKIWVFELNAYKKVKDDNGTVKYEKVSDFDGKKLKMYIELGNDWDMNDVSYLYIDENSKVTSWSKFLDIEIKEINGEMKTFAILNLKHFSTHMVYDEKKVSDIVDDLRKAAEDAKANYIKNLPEGKIATEDELNQIAADALTKAYDALDENDRKQLDKYLEQMGLTATPEADKTDNSKTENGSTASNSKANSSTSGNSSTSDNSSTSGNSSTSNKSSRSTSSTAKTGKNETLSALLFLLCGGGTLSLNLAMRKKYFNA